MSITRTPSIGPQEPLRISNKPFTAGKIVSSIATGIVAGYMTNSIPIAIGTIVSLGHMLNSEVMDDSAAGMSAFVGALAGGAIHFLQTAY